MISEIEKHKWLLSEKLNRDVGMKVAALDYLENAAGQELDDTEPSEPLLPQGLDAKIDDLFVKTY